MSDGTGWSAPVGHDRSSVGRQRQPKTTAPDPRSKTVCKYFLSNACSKGAGCPFSHVREAAGGARVDNVCKYYLQGHCSYGTRCRYDHVKAKPLTSQKPPVKILKPEARIAPTETPSSRGLVPLDKTLWSRGRKQPPMDPTAPKFSAESDAAGAATDAPDNNDTQTAWTNSDNMARQGIPYELRGSLEGSYCEPVMYEANASGINGLPVGYGGIPAKTPDVDQLTEQTHRISFRAEIDENSKSVECSICMDVVHSKPRLNDRRFGILSGCDHPFCLNCIRVWRQSSETGNEVVRTCPICRAVSYFVVPSTVFVTDGDEKEALVAAYRRQTKKINCRHFAFGKGTCPFGSSCFYKHEYEDGTGEQHTARFRQDGTGQVVPVRQVHVSDFLDHRENMAQQ